MCINSHTCKLVRRYSTKAARMIIMYSSRDESCKVDHNKFCPALAWTHILPEGSAVPMLQMLCCCETRVSAQDQFQRRSSFLSIAFRTASGNKNTLVTALSHAIPASVLVTSKSCLWNHTWTFIDRSGPRMSQNPYHDTVINLRTFANMVT
jgi:hypothetical protein